MNKISRRDFMRQSVAMGVTVAAAELAWTKLARAEQKKGGHMRMALVGGSTTDTLNPFTWADTFMALIGYSMRGNLVEVAADGSAKPELAESFEAADKGAKWIFTLRKGATFSNGKSLTPDDVVKTFKSHGAEGSNSAVKSLMAAITDIKADGDNKVVFTLAEPNADFPFLTADYHLNVLAYNGDEVDYTVGCGPYLLKDFQPGVRAILERNPNCYKQGFLDSAEMVGVTDPATRQLALQSGETDMINRPDLKTAELLAQTAGLKVVDTPGRLHYTLAGDARSAPFNNVDYCLAMKYGIDRQAFLDKILYGHGQIGNDSPITPSYKYFDSELKPRAYDPDKAKYHLKKSGLEGVEVGLSSSDTVVNGAVDAALLLADAAAKGGLKINVIREPADGYWDNVWLKKQFTMCWWGGRPTEDLMFTIAYQSAAPWNESHWSSKKFDDLLVAARAELDDTKRRGMYVELQHIVADEGSTVVPAFASNVHASNDKVVTPEQRGGAWELDNARCIERWSMAS